MAWAQDARIAQAQALSYRGDTAAAAALWEQIAKEAPQQGDSTSLDIARKALATLAFQKGDYDRFSALQQQRLQEAIASADQRTQADVEMELATLKRRQGHLDEARKGFNKAIEGFRNINDRDGEGQALNHLALILLNQGSYVDALETLERVQALYRDGANVDLDRTYQYLGLLYLNLGDLDESHTYLERGLKQAEATSESMREAPLLGSLARVSNDAEKYERALAYSNRAFDIGVRFHSTPGQAYSLLERGRALLGLEQFSEARKALLEARRLSLSISQERTAADATFVLGRIALAEGDESTALRLFKEATSNYETANDIPQMAASYRLMIPLLQTQGEESEALRLAVAALSMQEQISGRDMNRRMALLKYRYQAADDARRIELLEQQNEVAHLRLDQQTRNRWQAIAVSIGLGVFVLVLAAAYWRSRRLLSALAISQDNLAQANLALEEKASQLTHVANTDALTGIANRRHIRETLTRTAEHCHAHGTFFAVMMLDVDHFKRINDSCGHGVGDRVLQHIAQLMQASLPEGAQLGRYGGEEFLVVLPGHSPEAARALAHHLCATVASTQVEGGPPITISIGVAASDVPMDVDLLTGAADRVLYQAKKNGRNRVEVASLPPVA